ncbi:MAG: hypothetical protein KatS3mg002_0871 [Candidatus Woesearchaeota archaeon]|nr:MAG: hypothetical protein KatS3mg002_0871 [Candidatus Woesearchaeota archaeon]
MKTFFVIKGNDDICKLCNNMYNCNDQTNDTRDRLFLKIYGLTENKMYTSKEILEILAETVPPQNYQQNSPLENFLETITPIAVMGTILGGFALGAGLIEKLFGNNNDANTSNNNNNNNTSNNANQKNNNYNKNF